jgi:GDPmannose 4,6-dehydratase
MWLILQQDKPDDFVISTGETHTIKEFVGYVEKASGKKIKIIHDKQYDRPTDVPVLCGDSSKALRVLGWKPIVKAEELAKIMYEAKQNGDIPKT